MAMTCWLLASSTGSAEGARGTSPSTTTHTAHGQGSPCPGAARSLPWRHEGGAAMDHEMTIVEAPNCGWDERIRLFRAGTEVDVFVVITSRYVVFVDTTATPENTAAIAETMRPALATRLSLVIDTHADYDHAWGNAAFAGPDGALP